MKRSRTIIIAFMLAGLALGGAGWVAWETRWNWAYEPVGTEPFPGPPEPWFASIPKHGVLMSKFKSRFLWPGPPEVRFITDRHHAVLCRVDVYPRKQQSVIHYSSRLPALEVQAHLAELQSGATNFTRGPDLP